MAIITTPDEDAEDAADLRALRAAKAEEGDAPTMSMKEAAKLWGIDYVGDVEMAGILADTELVDDLKAGHEEIKAGRVTFMQ